MLSFSARALGFYGLLAFPLALLCAIPYFRFDLQLDEEQERRRLRTAQLLSILSPLHVLFHLTALGIVRDTSRLTNDREATSAERRRSHIAAIAGAVVSAAAFIVLA